MIRQILFDLDGTLIDSWRLYMEAYRLTFEGHFGRAFQDTDTLHLLALRPRSETWLLQKVLGRTEGHDSENRSDAFEQFLRHYRHLHDTHFDGTYAGIPEMLQAMRAAGYKLGIVTGKSRPAWTITEAKACLTPFDVVITETEVREPKPHPEGILTALRQLDGLPSETLYIGDSLLDGEAAGAAGVSFGAAVWAKSPAEAEQFVRDTLAQGAQQVFRQPAEILAALAKEPRTHAGAQSSPSAHSRSSA